MERSWWNLFVTLSLEQFVAKTNFIGFFVVLRHGEHDANDSTNQTSYIREVFIYFVKFSLKGRLGYGFLKANLDHRTFQRRYWLRSKYIIDPHNCLLLQIFKRQETWVGFDGILPDEASNHGAQLTGEEKNIPVLDIKILVNLIPSIDKCVDNWDSNHKLSQLCLNSSKHDVTHASSISCAVASIYSDYNPTEQIWRYFTL